VEAVVYGNLEADKVQPIMERIVSDLSQQALPLEERFYEQVRQIPVGTTLTFQQDVTVNNSAIVLELQQGDDTPENWATLQVLSQWIQPQFYNELRTRQQTGYIVSSGSTLTEETLSLFFLIQSGDFAPDEIDEATGRLFQILFEEDGDFDFKSDKLRSLASLEHQEFLKQGRQMLEPTQQRQLVLQMVGAGMSSLLPQEGVVRDARDMAERLPCPEFCRPN
jgi:secreted Zn-dependent insulinase-like peptidase